MDKIEFDHSGDMCYSMDMKYYETSSIALSIAREHDSSGVPMRELCIGRGVSYKTALRALRLLRDDVTGDVLRFVDEGQISINRGLEIVRENTLSSIVSRYNFNPHRESELRDVVAEYIRSKGIDAETEVSTESGFIDILTENTVCEVETVLTKQKLHEAIGQVFLYGNSLEKDRKLVIVAWDATPVHHLRHILERMGVRLWEALYHWDKLEVFAEPKVADIDDYGLFDIEWFKDMWDRAVVIDKSFPYGVSVSTVYNIICVFCTAADSMGLTIKDIVREEFYE